MRDEDNGSDLDIEGDEDEETLNLKLAAIQAKLRLKKLQAAKARKTQESEAPTLRPGSRSIPDMAILSRAQSRGGHTRSRSGTDDLKSAPTARPQSQADIQVPASPVRRAQATQEITSPSRVRLGIDKGLRAKDVSLKRAPSFKRTSDSDNNGQRAGYLRRATTPSLGVMDQPLARERPKSFSERLAAARNDEKARQERQVRIQQARSSAFQLGKTEMEELKQNATELPDVVMQDAQYSRDEIMTGSDLRRNSVPKLQRQISDDRGRANSQQSQSFDSQPPERFRTRTQQVAPSEIPEEEASAFEPYSSTHLKKRIIPHPTLTRNLSGKVTYLIPDLLKHVKAPEFQLPDVEQDIVVFGILASKSDPRAHKNTGSNIKEKAEPNPAKEKYMVLKLVDLKWEIELFLFNSGFERYWKLTPGTLLAILNPTIMPPPPNRTDTGKFSLVINSDDDTILEVGTARDLGFCKSVKKDGTLCSSWVNSKRTEFCEFHMNLALSKKRLARQEVNAFDTGLGPGKRTGSNRQPGGWEAQANDPGKKQRGNYDRSTQSTWFLQKPSAATMLDNEILGGRITDTIERSEALRRRLATEEKERDMMKKLGEVGNGAGREYMLTGQRSTKGGPGTTNRPSSSLRPGMGMSASFEEPRRQLDAKSLGLVGDKNNKIHLSPIKRKRGESLLSSRSSSALGSSFNGTSAAAGTAALGWGGGLKSKLARMKEGEKLGGPDRITTSNSTGSAMTSALTNGNSERTAHDDFFGGGQDRQRSPARKKTRFITEKGIREAGRESLGADLAGSTGRAGGDGRRMVFLDDDDEGMVILE